MRIGADFTFGELSFEWSGSSLRVTRTGATLAEVEDVARVSAERRSASDGTALLLLRLELEGGTARVLFVDADERQSGAREVPAHLETLDAGLAWLLPAGYVSRQGDVAVYAVTRLPAGLQQVPPRAIAREAARAIGRRHLLEPLRSCRLWLGRRRTFLEARGSVRLVHPEHAEVSVAAGLYELVVARGEPLGARAEVRVAKTPFLTP